MFYACKNNIFFLFLILVHQKNKKILKKLLIYNLKKIKNFKKYSSKHSQMLILKKVNHTHSFQIWPGPRPGFQVLTKLLGCRCQFFLKKIKTT